MQAKTARDYGWVSARLTEDTRDRVDALRADGGLRSMSATLELMIGFIEGEHREAFIAHARESQSQRRRQLSASTEA